jgi:hypothetical protein
VNYDQRAIRSTAIAALTAAVQHEHDFAGWLADALAAVAARHGSSYALVAGRPGSWEAGLVTQLVRGTIGWDDEHLDSYRDNDQDTTGNRDQHWCEDCEPEITVSAGTAGHAAEVLALIGKLIDAEPPVFAAISRFLDAQGADQLPATESLIGSISDLASRLGGALEAEGISVDRILPRFRRPDRTR